MTHEQTMWILLYPSQDLPGTWIGHCLDIDVVTQGAGFLGALHATVEAVGLTISDDLENTLDPFDRESAPEQDWAMLYGLMRNPERMSLSQVPESERDGLALVATQLRVSIDKSKELPREETAPEPWTLAAAHRAAMPSCHA